MKTGIGIVCAMMLAAGLPAPAEAAEGEKILFGFEREEAESAAGKMKDPGANFELLENGDFLFYRLKPGFHEREMYAIRPMRCVKSRASRGEYSCRVEESLGSRMITKPSFRLPRLPVMSVYKKFPQANLRIPELLNTCGWGKVVLPPDWSAYEALRVDVLIENGEVESLMLEVEDDLVEPPVSLTYAAPDVGTWVTLEMSLPEAVRERKLNTGRMNNIWIRVVLKDAERQASEIHRLWKAGKREEVAKRRFVAYVDNIRLCAQRTPSAHPILRGTRSAHTMKLPRTYAAKEHFTRHEFQGGYLPEVVPADTEMPEPADVKPDLGPVALSAPSVIPIRDMIEKGCLVDEPANAQIHSNIRLTCTAALDPTHIVVGFDIYGAGSLRTDPRNDRVVGNHACVAVGTVDGGKTWMGVAGTEYPTVVGGNQSKIPPRLWDLGGDVMGVGAFGCLAIRGAHVGYAADRAFCIRTVFTGKKWWVSPQYFITGETRHCHWLWWADVVRSPSGRIWMMSEAEDRYSYEDRRKYSVFVYYSDNDGVTWQSWRGPGFSGSVPTFGSRRRNMRFLKAAPYGKHVAVFGGGSWTRFDGRNWSELEKTDVVPWGVVSCGEEIYLSGPGGPVTWYDGKVWNDFSVPGEGWSRGKMAVCGDKTVMFVASDKNSKRLLCWKKEKDGEWKGPQVVVSEETAITQIVCPRYAPANFVPVAYMCRSREEEGKEKGGPLAKFVPGLQHYNGSPAGSAGKYFWAYPSRHWIHEPWIKVVKVPAAAE